MLMGAGCGLTEVVATEGKDVLVVEAVLREGDDSQRVLLHHSIQQGIVRGESGARVSVRTPEGREVMFQEAPLQRCAHNFSPDQAGLEVRASCYVSDVGELDIRSGATYELRVETADGLTAGGRSRVPGAFHLRTPESSATVDFCSLPPGANLELVWSVAEGAWSYVASLRIRGLREALQEQGIEAPDLLELTGLAISQQDTTLILPREFGVFERLDVEQEILRVLQNGFPEGVDVEVVVAAADRNYVNGVRGGGFNPSGNVRISSIVGDGVGVFGSLVPRRFQIRVREEASGPSCLATARDVIRGEEKTR